MSWNHEHKGIEKSFVKPKDSSHTTVIDLLEARGERRFQVRPQRGKNIDPITLTEQDHFSCIRKRGFIHNPVKCYFSAAQQRKRRLPN